MEHYAQQRAFYFPLLGHFCSGSPWIGVGLKYRPALRKRISVSVFRKGPTIEALLCAAAPLRELCYRPGCLSNCSLWQVYKRKPLAIWPLVFRRSMPWCWLHGAEREPIFFCLSLCVCPPGPALPHAAWGTMSCCPDESEAFCRWTHSSSAPGLQLWRLPSLPLFRKRGALTLSAAAGTFENNCLYDCYFSYLFEEV